MKMSIIEYRKREKELNFEHWGKIHQLRLDYAKSQAEFKRGDFIYNVTGIIKIEAIGYKLCLGTIEVIYEGYRYKKEKGVLSRTRDKKMSSLGSNVKKMSYERIN